MDGPRHTATDRKQSPAAPRQARDEFAQQLQERTAELAHTIQNLEAEVRQRLATEQDLQRTNQLLRMVNECSQALVRIDDEQALMQEICRLILEIGGYRMAWVGYADDDEARSVRPAAYVGSEQGYLEQAGITWADTQRGRGPTGTAIRTGQVRICNNLLTDPKLAPWREQALKRGFQSSIALPLTAAGKVFGALSIYASQPAAFSEPQVKVLTELADDLAFGISALRTHAALRQSRQLLQNVVHNAPVLIWAVDTMGICTLFDGELPALGLVPEQVVGRHIREIIGDHPDIPRHVAQAQTGQHVIAEVEYGGLNFDARYSPLKNADGRITGVICVATDVTQRRQVEREVLEATEQERRRIGRDLHDSIQASLAGVGFLLAALQQKLTQKGNDSAGDVDSIGEVVKGIIEQTRALSRGLCPLQLECSGLTAALEHLASTMRSLFRVPCRLYCDKTVLVRDETVAAQLYYICQEAVNNAVKHAKAQSIEIHVTGEADRLCLQIRDDGVGLPKDAASAKGMGLRIMDYRARALGAHLEILPAGPRGTVVTCTLRCPHIEVGGRQ